MSPTTSVEDRLAIYRTALDAAIAERSSAIAPPGGAQVVEVGIVPDDPNGRPGRSRLLVGVAVVVTIVGLGALIALRDPPSIAPSNPGSSGAPATAPNLANTMPPTDTAPPTVVEGSGTTPACPPDTGTIATGTLYLGGPPSAQNLAAPGFIFSLPSGPSPVDIALKAIALPVLGLECSLLARPSTNPDVVVVTVDPPATPDTLQFAVTVAETDSAIGVTAIDGSTLFDADTSNLRLTSGLTADAVRVQVRFKKGEDVWELTAEPTTGVDIALAVPNGEADRFPGEPIDWVLFTVLDSQDRVLDAGGRLVED